MFLLQPNNAPSHTQKMSKRSLFQQSFTAKLKSQRRTNTTPNTSNDQSCGIAVNKSCRYTPSSSICGVKNAERRSNGIYSCSVETICKTLGEESAFIFLIWCALSIQHFATCWLVGLQTCANCIVHCQELHQVVQAKDWLHRLSSPCLSHYKQGRSEKDPLITVPKDQKMSIINAAAMPLHFLPLWFCEDRKLGMYKFAEALVELGQIYDPSDKLNISKQENFNSQLPATIYFRGCVTCDGLKLESNGRKYNHCIIESLWFSYQLS